MTQKELWKDIKGFEGLYQISSFGNVRSIPRPKSKGGMMKLLLIPRNNYFLIKLHKNGVETRHFIHKLVASAFIPNPLNKPQVNHKNGNKLDNRVTNLEWVTCKENIEHAYRHRLHKTRQVIQSKSGCIVRVYRNSLFASKETGIIQSSIWYCLNGRQKTAGGYEWCYVNSIKGKRLLDEDRNNRI